MSVTYQVATIIVILIIVSIIIAIKIRNKKQFIDKKIKLALRPYTQDIIENIVFPDGVGGLVDIEKLVLLKQGILIIETYPVSGHLFGAEKIDQWTQMVNGKSYKFTNPLYRIHMLQQAVQVIAPGTPIFCCVIFTAKDSSFPKGKPEQVSTLESIDNDLLVINNFPAMNEKQQTNWERILRIARKDGQAAIESGGFNG